jgi:hypothetical protein
MIQVHIKGPGAVTLALLDRTGRPLLKKRITISGDPSIEARSQLPSSVETTKGNTPVVAVLIRKTGDDQDVTFDGVAAASYLAHRCHELRLPSKVAGRLREIVATLATRDEEGTFFSAPLRTRRR